MRSLAGVAVLLLAACGLSAAEEVGRLVASKEPGWPQWRGPRRDGISDEKGLLQSWPEGGPKLLWTASGLGRGYSSPIITRGTITITGDVGEELRVFALDLEGKPRWRSQNGRSWKGSYPGARGSCAFDEGRLYTVNAHNRVACLDAADGKELWAVDLLERFGGRNITWAIAHAPLIDGPRVIVTPGGTKALMAALDKRTGETLWATEPLMFERAPGRGRVADGPGYSSPILFEFGGRRHIVNCSTRHAFGVDADTGKLLWTQPMPTRFEVIAITPVLYRDCVFVTGPDGHGGKLFRIRGEGGDVRTEEVWTTDMDTCHGGVVLVDGVLYGSWYRAYNTKGCWGCVDAATGKTLYQMTDLVKGSLIYADSRLYCLDERGTMALLEPTPGGFQFRGRFRLTDGRRDDAWAHPVVLDGRLYLRYHDNLSCYDIRSKEARTDPKQR